MQMHRQVNRFTSSAHTSEIKDLVSKGLFEQTLKFYKQELHLCEGLHRNNFFILPSVIKACSSLPFLHFGLQLHCCTLKTGSVRDIVVGNSLLAMYAKCSRIESAAKLFDTMPERDTITWNSMINSYIQNGDVTEAIAKFKQMYLSGFLPKPELIASILSICGHMGELTLGRQIHAHIVSNGTTHVSIYLSTALLDMYSRCFDLHAACHVFNRVDKNEVSWTAMIAGCVMNKCYNMSLNCFRAMQVEGFKPNRVTLIAVLPACAELGSMKHGKQIHGFAFRHGFESESHLASVLLDMYCKCERTIEYASLVFERSEDRDIVMWSTMIRNYSHCRENTRAIKLFHRMQMEGMNPNSVTLLAVISSCHTNHTQAIHGYILRTGVNSDLFVGNAMIDMYAKYGDLVASQRIFNEIPATARDSASWSALIRSYGLHGYGEEALQLFHEMQEKCIEPDGITFLAVLSACNHAGLIEEGHKVFEAMMKNNKIAITMEHYACYVDLLGRCGHIEDAIKVISNMSMKPSPTIWSSLVSSCKTHGRMDLAKILVHQLITSESDNAANYVLLRMVYAETGDWHGVEEVQKVMEMKGITKGCGYSRLEHD